MNVLQVDHVCLRVIAEDEDTASRLTSAFEASATIGRVEHNDPEIIEVEVEDAMSVREAVLLLVGIASTVGLRPSSFNLGRDGGIQV